MTGAKAKGGGSNYWEEEAEAPPHMPILPPPPLSLHWLVVTSPLVMSPPPLPLPFVLLSTTPPLNVTPNQVVPATTPLSAAATTTVAKKRTLWSLLFLLALAITAFLSSLLLALHGFEDDGAQPLLLPAHWQQRRTPAWAGSTNVRHHDDNRDHCKKDNVVVILLLASIGD